ncbi:MAG: MFS transporter [Steroidobacteraceae bacterium]
MLPNLHNCRAGIAIRAPDLSVPLASRRVVLAAVFSSSLGVGLIFGFQPPLIALVLSRGGSSNFAIGAVTAASLIAVILLGPLYPRVLARLGLKRSVVAGVTLGALILMIMPAWPGVESWLFLRCLTGCALGLSWIASEVWMNNVSGADARGTVMGIYGTVFSIGTMAGPALLEFTGTRGWQPFAIGAVVLLVTLLPLLVLRRVTSEPQAFTPMRELGGAIRGAPVIMLAALVAGLVESAELTLLPLFGIHAGFHDREALLLVTVFMAGNVVLQAPIGLLADRFGRRAMLGVCAALSGVGPLLLQPWISTPALLWPLLFIWGGTLYAFYSQGIALLGGTFAASELPTANTVFVMVYCLGGVIGPSVGGMAMDAWPRHGLQGLLSGAAFLLLTGLALGAIRRTTER